MKIFSIPILLLTFFLLIHFLGTNTSLMANYLSLLDNKENTPILLPRENQTPITVVAPPWLPLFIDQMNKEIQEKAKEYGFPTPKIELELNPTQIVVNKITGTIEGWILGYYTYETKIITVFLWGPPYGAYFSEEELRYTILHEILHFWDDYLLKPKVGVDHNGEFDKRLKGLGWVKPDFKSYMLEKSK